MKICTRCKIEKELIEFGKNKAIKGGYRFQCKKCRNEQLRTGKLNLGRFKKGEPSLRKGCKLSLEHIEKSRLSNIGRVPWNKGKHNSNYRNTRAYEWSRQIKERDGNECKKCGSKEYLHAHHIIPWKENKELRFDISNGITVCRKCHLKIEPRREKGYVPSEESRRKASETSKGQRRSIKTEFKKSEKAINPFPKGHIPWNKGTKGVMKAWNKGLKKVKV